MIIYFWEFFLYENVKEKLQLHYVEKLCESWSVFDDSSKTNRQSHGTKQWSEVWDRLKWRGVHLEVILTSQPPPWSPLADRYCYVTRGWPPVTVATFSNRDPTDPSYIGRNSNNMLSLKQLCSCFVSIENNNILQTFALPSNI